MKAWLSSRDSRKTKISAEALIFITWHSAQNYFFAACLVENREAIFFTGLRVKELHLPLMVMSHTCTLVH